MKTLSFAGFAAAATAGLFIAAAQTPAFAHESSLPAAAVVNVDPVASKSARVESANRRGDSDPTLQGGFATSPVASFSWNWNGVTINVPGGCFLNMTVQGSGLKLSGTISGVECIGPAATIPGLFCNWSGVYRFLDSSGREYARQATAVRNGCGQASFNIPGASQRTMRTGSICVDFRNNGTTRGTTCMAVFP